MSERRVDRKTRLLIAQIDECLGDAERLRNHISKPQPRIWPDRRRSSRIPGPPGKTMNDDGHGSR